jgi:D-3-phosphoglycerate dehydrogenase
MKPACLIIDQMHPSILPMLEEAGVAVTYLPEIEAAEVKPVLKDYEILVVRSKLQITEEVLTEARNLKIICRAGAGVDNIDKKALEKRNIRLINAPEGNRDAVGEFTIGLLLSLFRNISKADKEVKNYKWLREPNRGEEISGKTIGIIGYGNMGKAFARCLSGFECTVLAYDTAGSQVYDSNATACKLDRLFAEADVISFHIPFTPENFHLAGQEFFGSFQKPIWVLNTARGEIMDYSALVNGLKTGNIKGAALDVLENEKLAKLNEVQKENFDFLSEAENVILTPHIAGWSHQSYQKINAVLVRKLQDAMFEADRLR